MCLRPFLHLAMFYSCTASLLGSVPSPTSSWCLLRTRDNLTDSASMSHRPGLIQTLSDSVLFSVRRSPSSVNGASIHPWTRHDDCVLPIKTSFHRRSLDSTSIGVAVHALPDRSCRRSRCRVIRTCNNSKATTSRSFNRAFKGGSIAREFRALYESSHLKIARLQSELMRWWTS